MKFHWKVLLWMLAGVLAGLGMQSGLAAPPTTGASWGPAGAGVAITKVPSHASKHFDPVDVLTAVILDRGRPDRERRIQLTDPEQLEAVRVVDGERVHSGIVSEAEVGDLLWFVRSDGAILPLALEMDPASPRARWIAPFDFLADIFMALLKMLIVPLVMSSIISGVAGVGSPRDLGRLGGKTFAYYITTSLLAIFLGQLLVNVIQPGSGAALGLSPLEAGGIAPDESFLDVFKRMIPTNVVMAMGAGEMLQMIFFSLLFGFFITVAPEPHGEHMRRFFEGVFQVMLKMAEAILKLLPYAVFALIVRVVAKTGFAVFEPLLLYMFTVVAALVLHSVVTLPLLLRFVGRLSPRRWFQAVSPALMTAFSTSSSSMTLPVTLEAVEKRGKVSNKVTSFTLPLGATINMDGTALYECIGVIFLAQYYQATGDFELTLAKQAMVVLMALMASIGAAGIPSAGLIMMLTILAALGLPLEGAALLLAVDRPLDMLRTVVNVWSDSCGAAVIARSEGEQGPLTAGADT